MNITTNIFEFCYLYQISMNVTQAKLTVLELPPELKTTFLPFGVFTCQAEAKRAWHLFSYTLKLSAPSMMKYFARVYSHFVLSLFGLLILPFLFLLGCLSAYAVDRCIIANANIRKHKLQIHVSRSGFPYMNFI